MDNNFINLKKMRSSKNLDLVLSILESANSPVAAEYIYQCLLGKKNSVSLSTIYRILEKLTNNKIAVKTVFRNENKAKFELNRHGHKHYLICTECNDMIPINVCPIIGIEEALRTDTGFNINGHKLEVYGQCAKCKSN